MSSTLVNISRSGWTRLNMDMYYEDYSYLYYLELERLIGSADAKNFFSYKCLTLEYYVDHTQRTLKLPSPRVRLPDMPAWHVANIEKSDYMDKRWWKNIYCGECPGVFEVSEREHKANPDFPGFYSDYEKAKSSFICSVRQGHVYREQRIVSRVPMTWSDEHFGTTCDDEIIQLAEGWHVVTVGREPGVFVSDSRFKAHSTHANICDIEGGSLAAFSTWKSAVKHFSDTLAAGFVERVSVVTVRENMAEADYPGLITPWEF